MATFDFGAKKQTPGRPKMVSGRELLIRKAAQLEAERLAKLQAGSDAHEPAPAAALTPPAPAAPATSTRKPRIPNALFAGGRVNLPVKAAQDQMASQPTKTVERDVGGAPSGLPSSLMSQVAQAGAVRLVDNERFDIEGAGQPRSSGRTDDAKTVVLKQSPTASEDAKVDVQLSGFNFKGAASNAELERSGVTLPPVDPEESAIPRHLELPQEAFFYEDVPVDEQFASYEPDTSPILSQRGAHRSGGLSVIAGIPATTFEGWEPRVPPGSHYDEWVWNALDKPGYVTIELYVDARHLSDADKPASVLEQAYQPNASNSPGRARPKFDPDRHVLISVPQPSHAPWQDATRVLLTPETIKLAAVRKENRGSTQFGAKNALGTPEPEKKERPPSWESEPSGISAWLNMEPHHNVIFGRVLLDAMARHGGQMYWMVLSQADAERIHKRIYGTGSEKSSDPEHKFGLEGLQPVKSSFDEAARKYTSSVIPVHERRPIPPAKRYLGHWSDANATRAIQLAQQGAGPQFDHWPPEDVQFVLDSHAGLQARKKTREKAQEHTVITPRVEPSVDLPAAKPKEKGPENKMRMRMYN